MNVSVPTEEEVYHIAGRLGVVGARYLPELVRFEGIGVVTIAGFLLVV